MEKNTKINTNWKQKNNLEEIESPIQNLTFNQLKDYYKDKNLIEKADFITKTGSYNYIAFLLSDQNTTSIKIKKYASCTKDELIKSYEYGNCSLITSAFKVLEAINIKELFSNVETNQYDERALRESIINSIIHNNYSSESSESSPIIEIFSDRIVINSSGGLVLGKSENLENVLCVCRNQKLEEAFRKVGLTSSCGLGVLRILNCYDRASFDFGWNYLKVTFKYEPQKCLENNKI